MSVWSMGYWRMSVWRMGVYNMTISPYAADIVICIYCSKTKGFEKEQRLVYQIIEDAGNKGIWMRDIRGKSNIVQSELTRCLRTLESRKLIKSVRSVQAARRKVGHQEMGRLNDGQVLVELVA